MLRVIDNCEIYGICKSSFPPEMKVIMVYLDFLEIVL